jgi:hypothetical protein
MNDKDAQSENWEVFPKWRVRITGSAHVLASRTILDGSAISNLHVLCLHHNLKQEAASSNASSGLSVPRRCVTSLVSIFVCYATCESIVGDLQERYLLKRKAHGQPAAAIWFWCEVIHSVLSLAFDSFKKVSDLEKLYHRIRS